MDALASEPTLDKSKLDISYLDMLKFVSLDYHAVQQLLYLLVLLEQ